MLCDNTGGEGRNFQCADYIIHIDLPWDASLLEQRIGRLDRLERDPERSVVTSIVPFAGDTFEEALFDFFSNGLRIFEHIVRHGNHHEGYQSGDLCCYPRRSKIWVVRKDSCHH